MAKKKFICKVCGYVHEGDAAPEKCPVCNAPASEFVEQKPKGLFSDVNSNAYIILYSVVMVVLVAALLAVASFSLQDRQNANILNEKQQQIVKALGEDPLTVKYGDVIAEAQILDADGNRLGEVTSGALSPTLGYPVAMGYVTTDAAAEGGAAAEGATVTVDIRGKAYPYTVVALPFYSREK